MSRPRHPEAHYRAVAALYLASWAAGDSPNGTIADAWNVPKTTANRWVKRAKELGLLERPHKCRACKLHCPQEVGR